MNTSGETQKSSSMEREFNVQMDNPVTVGEECVEAGTGIRCYSLMRLPKSGVAEKATSSLKERDEVLYKQLIQSKEYKMLLAEFK